MEVSSPRRKHAFDNPAHIDRFQLSPDISDSNSSSSSAKGGYFEIFIQPNAASPSTTSSSGSKRTSSSSVSGNLTSGVNFNETYIHMKCTRSVYETLWRKSLKLRSSLEHALSLQRAYITLCPEPNSGIDSSSLAFLIRNLHRDTANFASGVTVEDLVKLANTLCTYRCSPSGFVHGWRGIPQEYKTPRRTPPSPVFNRNGAARSWWAQPRLWGPGSRTPLRLLVIAWVFGSCTDEFNEILASELITAVWDCHVLLPTSVPEIQHIEDYRTQECTHIFEDFKTLTGSTGDSRKNVRMKQLRIDAAHSLGLDFGANCFESSQDSVANQNFAVLNSFTPYELLRNMESNLLGKEPTPSSHQGGRRRQKSVSVSREYPRDPPEINWKKVGSSMRSAFSGTFDSDVKAQKEEVEAILDRMEMMMHQRQLRLLAEWIKSRDNQQTKLINELEGIFTFSLMD